MFFRCNIKKHQMFNISNSINQRKHVFDTQAILHSALQKKGIL